MGLNDDQNHDIFFEDRTVQNALLKENVFSVNVLHFCASFKEVRVSLSYLRSNSSLHSLPFSSTVTSDVFFSWIIDSLDDVVGSGETPINKFPLLKLWQRKECSDHRGVSEPGSN